MKDEFSVNSSLEHFLS